MNIHGAVQLVQEQLHHSHAQFDLEKAATGSWPGTCELSVLELEELHALTFSPGVFLPFERCQTFYLWDLVYSAEDFSTLLPSRES